MPERLADSVGNGWHYAYVAPSGIVTHASRDELIGRDSTKSPFAETFGEDIRHVLETQEPRSFRRFINGQVLECHLSAYGEGVVSIHKIEATIGPHDLTNMSHVLESLNRLWEALVAPVASAPTFELAPSADQPHTARVLRLVLRDAGEELRAQADCG